MIVYNVTYSVDKEISEDWISWMKDRHVPNVLKKGLFADCRIFKVVTHEDERTFSYAVQYHSKSLKSVDDYIALGDDIQQRYGDKAISFPTLLQEV